MVNPDTLDLVKVKLATAVEPEYTFKSIVALLLVFTLKFPLML